MNDIGLKKLKERLRHSAGMLRAGAHRQSILGLIFLCYADVLFQAA